MYVCIYLELREQATTALRRAQKSALGGSWGPRAPKSPKRPPKVRSWSFVVVPEGLKLEAKIHQNSVQNPFKMQSLFWLVVGSISRAFWCQLGSNLGAKTLPKWRQVGFQEPSNKQTTKMSKICTAPKRELIFWGFRALKLEPKSIKNLSKRVSKTR